MQNPVSVNQGEKASDTPTNSNIANSVSLDGAMSSDCGDKCDICQEATSGHDLQCELCERLFHAVCMKIPEGAFDMLIKGSDEIGWVCKECRLETRYALPALKSVHAKLAEEICCLTAANRVLTERIVNLEQSSTAPAAVADVNWSSLLDTDDSGSRMELQHLVPHEVVTETRDRQHPQNNVTVTGVDIPPVG